MSFSDSAALPVGEIAAWADEEARFSDIHLVLAGEAVLDPGGAELHRREAAKHQARARLLYETLAVATVDQEKT